MRNRPCSLRPRVGAVSAGHFILLAKTRGMEHREAQSVSVSASSFEGCGRLSALHGDVLQRRAALSDVSSAARRQRAPRRDS